MFQANDDRQRVFLSGRRRPVVGGFGGDSVKDSAGTEFTEYVAPVGATPYRDAGSERAGSEAGEQEARIAGDVKTIPARCGAVISRFHFGLAAEVSASGDEREASYGGPEPGLSIGVEEKEYGFRIGLRHEQCVQAGRRSVVLRKVAQRLGAEAGGDQEQYKKEIFHCCELWWLIFRDALRP